MKNKLFSALIIAIAMICAWAGTKYAEVPNGIAREQKEFALNMNAQSSNPIGIDCFMRVEQPIICQNSIIREFVVSAKRIRQQQHVDLEKIIEDTEIPYLISKEEILRFEVERMRPEIKIEPLKIPQCILCNNS
jgi:hypothetical protein